MEYTWSSKSASLSWAAFTVLGAGLVRASGALEVTTAASALALPWVAVAALVEVLYYVLHLLAMLESLGGGIATGP